MKRYLYLLVPLAVSAASPALAESEPDNVSQTARALQAAIDDTAVSARDASLVRQALDDYKSNNRRADDAELAKMREAAKRIMIETGNPSPARINMLIDTVKTGDGNDARRELRQANDALPTKHAEFIAAMLAGTSPISPGLVAPALRLSKEEAEAAGWPCGVLGTAIVTRKMAEAAATYDIRKHTIAYRAAQAEAVKLKAQRRGHPAAHDCDDCPDCAEGSCTEAAHPAKGDIECVDCPEQANV